MNKFKNSQINKPNNPKLNTAAKAITSWSYSRFDLWRTCPQAAKFKFIDKLGKEEKKGAALIRGERIHKLAEDYTKGLLKTLPKELKLFTNQFKMLRSMKTEVEQMWCFTKEWKQTHAKDWNHIWLRIKTDCATVDGTEGHIIDHKTGQEREGYEEQLSLYGLGGFLRWPMVKKVTGQLWFLDSGSVVDAEYLAKDAKALQKDWERKVAPMLNATSFPAKPSGGACRFCQFAKSKGGPCQFG